MIISQNQMCLFAHRRYVCVCVNYINNLDHDLAGWSEGRLATTNHHSSSIHLSSTPLSPYCIPSRAPGWIGGGREDWKQGPDERASLLTGTVGKGVLLGKSNTHARTCTHAHTYAHTDCSQETCAEGTWGESAGSQAPGWECFIGKALVGFQLSSRSQTWNI